MSKKAIWSTVIAASIVVAIAVFFYLKEYKTEMQLEEQNLKELELEAKKITEIPFLNLE